LRPPFPWADALALGLGRLRLLPDQFWSLTPRELMLMAGAGQTPAALDRARLEALIAAHGAADPAAPTCPVQETSNAR
jgi:uncharacterized phage protein (TIGR02216 family)